MRQYPKYKDSEVEWMGEIPDHWEMIRIKFLGKSLIGLSYKPGDIVDDKIKGLLVLRASNIQEGRIKLDDNVYVNLKVKNEILLREGDILICSRSGSPTLIGKNIIIPKDLEGNTFGVFMTVFRTPYSDYISKVFNSTIFFNQSGLFLTSTINQLTQDTLNNIFVPFTHIETERNQIVSFLDQKTSIIDDLIQKKLRKIELLKEHRTSIINRAITKGLNPEVRLKDSGMVLIGEIPEHWSCVFVRHYSNKIGSGVTPRGGSEVYVESGITFIRSQNVQFDGLHLDDVVKITHETHHMMAGSQVKKGDLLLNITGASIGRCCVVDLDEEMNVNQHVCIIRTIETLSTVFLNYFLQSETGQDQLFFYITGANREGLTGENIKNFKVPFPPLPEQHQIVEYLDNKSSEIDKQVDLENRKIDLLKEYRRSLISEVVTGKIDVRTN